MGFSGSSRSNYIGAFYTWRLAGGSTLVPPRVIQPGKTAAIVDRPCRHSNQSVVQRWSVCDMGCCLRRREKHRAITRHDYHFARRRPSEYRNLERHRHGAVLRWIYSRAFDDSACRFGCCVAVAVPSPAENSSPRPASGGTIPPRRWTRLTTGAFGPSRRMPLSKGLSNPRGPL